VKLQKFRVEHFRSIRDTGWQHFSGDGVTALVGQNESGKSSIIDALVVGYGVSYTIESDDFRYLEGLPVISLEVVLDDDDLECIAETQAHDLFKRIVKLSFGGRPITLVSKVVIEDGKNARSFSYDEETAERISDGLSSFRSAVLEEFSGDEALSPAFKPAELREELWRCIPDFFLFRETRSSLPNRIDIVDGAFTNTAIGVRGARNFLAAASLDLKSLVAADARTLGTLLGRANAKITREIQGYWSQYLGADRKITLECELKNYGSEVEGKAGNPYLMFWVREGDERLYPSQRSRGTRWFLSFFLQLMAEKQQSPGANVFLLDEPATYLHPAAQSDVIRLIEKIAEESPVVYSTHSPYLLDHRKIHRVLAVERSESESDGGSSTRVKRGIELATASPLTLAPILGLIGADLSQQDVIKRSRNVILEEISAYYYLDAFKSILDEKREFHFIPASGADNVALIYDLMIAWRLDSVALLDDDPHGKQVCRAIKAKYQLSDDEAKRVLLRIDGCGGVEDLFARSDFVALVYKDLLADDQPISSLVKKMKLSKPMLAVDFWRRVRSGEVMRDSVGDETLGRFAKVFDRLEESMV